jgi:DNA-directed RNA polymerase subunit RPC12/RpoP
MKIKCIECGKEIGENDTDNSVIMTCDECMARLEQEIDQEEKKD